MGAQLNIKSDDACLLTPRAPELAGEGLNAVSTKAPRGDRDREQCLRDTAALCVRVLSLADEISADIPPGVIFDVRASSTIIATDRGVEQALTLCFNGQLYRRASALIADAALSWVHDETGLAR